MNITLGQVAGSDKPASEWSFPPGAMEDLAEEMDAQIRMRAGQGVVRKP